MNKLDKKCRIYVIDDDVDGEGNPIQFKHYLNEDDSLQSMFHCYFRTLSVAERQGNYYLGDDSTAQFEINQRKIHTNCFIEFKRDLFGLETFQIKSIDPFNDSKRVRMRIRVKKIVPPTFAGVRWGAEI